jgi:sugar O-acyltransferase (sialic acid O-acetyltransferase NeuD family)
MDYVIFGAGGFAKEVISYVLDDGHNILAVVSDDDFNNQDYNSSFVIKRNLTRGEFPTSKFILAVGDINYKKQIVQKNEDRWGTFVHRTAHVSKFAKVGRGCVVSPNSLIAADAVVGNFVTLNISSAITHDNVIGDYCTFSPYAGTMGHCKIGDECFFGTAAIVVPKVQLPAQTKVSAGGIVKKSIEVAATLYGDPAVPRIKNV